MTKLPLAAFGIGAFEPHSIDFPLMSVKSSQKHDHLQNPANLLGIAS
jgi:hypothetical protein